MDVFCNYCSHPVLDGAQHCGQCGGSVFCYVKSEVYRVRITAEEEARVLARHVSPLLRAYLGTVHAGVEL